MGDGTLLTRRALLLGALAAPSLLGAAPLLDTGSGRGLFSHVAVPRDGAGGSLNLFGGDTGSDLALGPRLTPGHAPQVRMGQPLRFTLRNSNTGEAMTLSTRPGERLTGQQTAQLNRFLRDWRRNEVKPIDGIVLSSLFMISGTFASGAGQVDVRITSGYRSKATNDMLRHKNREVARNSMHIQARAIDFSLAGVSSDALARVARKFCPGGVGRYSTFVHIDSGPKRSWSA